MHCIHLETGQFLAVFGDRLWISPKFRLLCILGGHREATTFVLLSTMVYFVEAHPELFRGRPRETSTSTSLDHTTSVGNNQRKQQPDGLYGSEKDLKEKVDEKKLGTKGANIGHRQVSRVKRGPRG
ncbi:hypothetical protein BKA64DRAFT_640617 [Cadophora sp. MPI-SDFR-AT-0126]|nr:hypothetical protein BKA64DRAFT_640617 [Leotiomycetes sp. MPI-SDFR-AT-0126]